jgi:transposase
MPIIKDLAARLQAEEKSAKEVAKTFGVHVSTIYRLYEAELP